MINKEEIINIGKFQKTHALKGELNMISDIDPEYFLEGNPLIVEYDGILVPYYVESVRPKGSTSFLIKLNGIDSEEAASEFVNKEIGMLRKDADEWLGEEYDDNESLIGYNIIEHSTNKIIGSIEDIEDSTANVLFVLEDQQGNEIYIPANPEFIVEIDDDNKKIIMNLPEGLIELNAKD